MKIHFYKATKKNLTFYTYELLKNIAIRNGHEICDMEDCDIIAISLTSTYEIDKLRILRNKTKKPIVAGGHAFNSPGAILCYANYLNLGQGYEFFENVKTIKDIESQPFILSRNKYHGIVSHHINWDICPVVQIGKYQYSYLYSLGCKRKCSFCLTSWINKYQKNQLSGNMKIISEKLGVKNQLYCITNDAESMLVKRNVSDATVKDYIKSPEAYKDIGLIRVGIEFVTEKKRKQYAKAVSDDELIEFFRLTKMYKQRVNCFFLAGMESQEDWENFKYIFGQDIESKPRIGVVVNYIDYSRGTPLENKDPFDIIPLNVPKIKDIWKMWNGRIVIFRDQAIKPYNSIFDSIIQRCDSDYIDRLLKLKKKTKFNSIDDMKQKITYKMDTKYTITNHYDKQLRKMKKHLARTEQANA